MFLKQFYLGCLAHASYLIGDEETDSALVVDPQRDIDFYLEEAARQGLHIERVFLTHLHADFVAGHIELRERVGARIHLGAAARVDYGFVPLREGEPLEIGRVRLEFLETPGHTPESISIVVFDRDESETTPHAVLTGDTLFIGDVGRPDLAVSAELEAAGMASQLYDSLYGKLLRLPDPTLVYPAHGAGSLCGKNMSTETVSTIGEQRLTNGALQSSDRAAFIDRTTADQPEVPPYFSHDLALNRRERQTLMEAYRRALVPLELETVLECQRDGAQLLDTRDAELFARGHLTGSLNVGLGGSYATWSGFVLDPARPILIVAEPGRDVEAVTRLGRIGFDNVRGYLDGGFDAARRGGASIERLERLQPLELAARLAAGDRPRLLDVRSQREWQRERIGESLNLPLPQLIRRWRELPREGELTIYCASGYRSSLAASLLLARGCTGLVDLAGGLTAWSKAIQEVA